MSINKLERYLFYLLLFAIPFNVRKVLYYPGWKFDEWQAVSIYATDLILLALFLYWVYSKNQYKLKTHDYFLLAFVVIAAISIKNTSMLSHSLYSFIKLVEFVLFYFYVKTYAIYRFNFFGALLAFVAGGAFQAIIAITQFFKQSSVGLWIMGESLIGPDMRGVAVYYNFLGEKVMRVYGATPHPNILAAYLLISIFALYFLWFHQKNYHRKHVILYLAIYALILFGLLFTFSRVILFLWVAGLVIHAGALYLNKHYKKTTRNGLTLKRERLAQIGLITVVIVGSFSFLYWPEVVSRVFVSTQEEAVQLRLFYAGESLKSGFNLLGVGIGDFVNWLSSQSPGLMRHLYQPVHNIYLLIYTETGILGLTSFLLFIVFLVKDFVKMTKLGNFHYSSFLLLLISFLFIGFFDHFLWTLQQGMLMFWLILALLQRSPLSQEE
jgi:O-antigen ligase